LWAEAADISKDLENSINKEFQVDSDICVCKHIQQQLTSALTFHSSSFSFSQSPPSSHLHLIFDTFFCCRDEAKLKRDWKSLLFAQAHSKNVVGS
jgi:hypothetical protein